MTEPWTFEDAELAGRFEREMAESIPDFHRMRELTAELAFRVAGHHFGVLDLGASTGGASFEIARRLSSHQLRDVGFELVEKSKPMIAAISNRNWGESSIKIHEWDLETGVLPSTLSRRTNVVFSILTLQFLSLPARAAILKAIKAKLTPHANRWAYDSMGELIPDPPTAPGVLFLVEKVMSPSFEDAFAATLDRHKIQMGVPEERIQAKKEALRGVMFPLTAKMNEQLLADAGFASVEIYWASGSFRGWICK